VEIKSETKKKVDPFMSLTGCWKLNHEWSSSQSDLLVALGRPFFQRAVIDRADEEFVLFHFYDEARHQTHFFEKHVTIHLLPSVVNVIKRMMPFLNIEMTQVKYDHMLVANGKPKQHNDDQKQFGPCESRTTWSKEVSDAFGFPGFTIRWYLANGLLKCDHFVDGEDRLNMIMEFTNTQTGNVGRAFKKYARTAMPPQYETLLGQHKYKQFLQ
jgi:hypothetical protein